MNDLQEEWVQCAGSTCDQRAVCWYYFEHDVTGEFLMAPVCRGHLGSETVRQELQEAV